MDFSGISLVTGAAGFMGSHVVETLVRAGIRVRATSRPRKDLSFFENLGVEYVGADLTKPATLPRLFEGNVDRVFHLGAICNFSTPYEKLSPTNVKGVDHMTRLAMENNVKCFVHVTSTSVYGYYKGKPFSEDDVREPGDDYGKSKKAGEDIVFEKIKQGLPAIIVRPCTVYGPRCNDGAGKVFSRPSAITAIPGSGDQKLSNIRAEDVADVLETIAQAREDRGEVGQLDANMLSVLNGLAASGYADLVRLALSRVTAHPAQVQAAAQAALSTFQGNSAEPAEAQAIRQLKDLLGPSAASQAIVETVYQRFVAVGGPEQADLTGFLIAAADKRAIPPSVMAILLTKAQEAVTHTDGSFMDSEYARILAHAPSSTAPRKASAA